MIPDGKTFVPSGISEIEDAAWKVITSSDRNMLLHAGPGTGKTEILAQKAAYLFGCGTLPPGKKILVLSYKRNSIRNLREKIRLRCSPEDVSKAELFTYDAFAKILLDKFGDALPECWRPSADYEVDEELLSPGTLKQKICAAVSGIYDLEEIGKLSLSDFSARYLIPRPLQREMTFSGKLESDLGIYMWRKWLSGKPSVLIFPMINALAELLLRVNPELKRAIRAEYGYVFLDEFQDTSFDQYRFLKTLFGNSKVPVIASGDEKQNIMLWANAMPDGMEKFLRDFNAAEFYLQWNWRSAPQLVEIQNFIAEKLLCCQLPEMIPVNRSVDGKCRVLSFLSENEEQNFVLNEINSLLTNGYDQRDIAVIVRRDSNIFAQKLNQTGKNHHIRFYDAVPLQNLLDEPAVKHLFDLWEVVFSPCAPEAWRRIADFCADKSPVDFSEFAKEVKEKFANAIFNREKWEKLISRSVEFIGEERFRGVYAEYLQGRWLTCCMLKLAAIADEPGVDGRFLPEVLESFRQNRGIPVLTVQRCKEREFRAVFFIGLEDNSFQDFSQDILEEGCAFFIALSRAQEKLYFTACRYRDDLPRKFSEIAPLYRMLAACGAELEQYQI